MQVCPTGIDIRDGLQYECIACAACIDACDSIMDKMNYPRGLVRYTTEHALQGEETHILRPRMFVYAALLTSWLAVSSRRWSRARRSSSTSFAIAMRCIANCRAMIENIYTLKIINQRNDDAQLRPDRQRRRRHRRSTACRNPLSKSKAAASCRYRFARVAHRATPMASWTSISPLTARRPDVIVEDSRFLGLAMNNERRNEQEDTKPWYRQFWPWFIIALPASAVVAGLTTLWIAVQTTDSLVLSRRTASGGRTSRVAAERLAHGSGSRRTDRDQPRPPVRRTRRALRRPRSDPKTLDLELSHPGLCDRDQVDHDAKAAAG